MTCQRRHMHGYEFCLSWILLSGGMNKWMYLHENKLDFDPLGICHIAEMAEIIIAQDFSSV